VVRPDGSSIEQAYREGMESNHREHPPHTNVIVGFGGNAESCDALAFGKLIAGATDAGLIVATAYPGRDGAATESRNDFFRRVFARAAYELGETSFTRCKMIDSPARGLHGLADAEGGSLIVVGSTHRGRFGEVLPGSVGNQLLAGSSCPVAVAPRGFDDGPRLATIGVAYDDGAESKRALQYGCRLAAALDAELRVITVGPRYGPLDLLFEHAAVARERLQERVEQGLAQVPPWVTAHGSVREGDPAAELAAASHDVDLLVLGSRSYGPLRSVLLGSVSADLVRTAACATLVIPRGFPVRVAAEDSEPLAAGVPDPSGATT
jgi:nucleotide-binding universal stress UspA family protein